MKISVFSSEYELVLVEKCHTLLSDAEAAVQGNKIYICKELTEDERIHALVHEIMHVLHPYKEERDVHMEALVLTDTLLVNGMISWPE